MRPASAIAREFGMSPRYWTRMAAEGKIPGAWQPSGEGGKWLFDVAKTREWWLAQMPADRQRLERQRLARRAAQAKGAETNRQKAELRRQTVTDQIYFVESAGLIKIGVSSNVQRRIHSFKTASATPITLLLVLDGSNDQERKLHERFAHLRSHGEWFRHEAELADFIAEKTAK